MTAPRPLVIEAVVADCERLAVVAACEQLSESLSAATSSPWPAQLRLRPSLRQIDLSARPSVIVASLLPELARAEEPASSIARRWQEDIRMLGPTAGATVFLCTVFRRIHTGVPPGITIERIRRLNLIAIELSRDTGALVIDIDAVLAHVGARAMSADFRLASESAIEVAGYSIASAILAADLDDVIPPDVQERAKRLHGNIGQIFGVVERRLAEKAKRARANARE